MNQRIDSLSQQIAKSEARLNQTVRNIANVNTPGYKAAEVAPFSSLLKDGGQEENVIQLKSHLKSRPDGNNVSIDEELGDLKEFSLRHRAFTQLLAARIRQMRSAISNST